MVAPTGVLGDELHPGEGARILAEEILPAVLHGAVAQERPVVVFVAGQAGSGKTLVVDLVHAALARRGQAVRVDHGCALACEQEPVAELAPAGALLGEGGHEDEVRQPPSSGGRVRGYLGPGTLLDIGRQRQGIRYSAHERTTRATPLRLIDGTFVKVM
ncbi:zeta toxin family protein [Kitasatospora aureofaciens]|uniref:zeta toxin family protein n=1 Tax=Kitasatospora aureofaciens TaxID=1894 RepID=UPI0027DF6BF1|nr:zeta toxin family protein [Kitasatospora aureofaciens]